MAASFLLPILPILHHTVAYPLISVQAVQCPFRAGVLGTLAVLYEEGREKSHALGEFVSTGTLQLAAQLMK